MIPHIAVYNVYGFVTERINTLTVSQARSGQDNAAFSSAGFMVTGPQLSLVKRLKELFGGEPLPELPPRHGHGGCQQRCQQVEEESDPGDVDSEPEDESEPDEPEFETSLDFNRRVTAWQSTM